MFRAVLLEKPPPSKRTASVHAHARHNSSGSRSFLSVFENKSGVKGSGVRSLPSSPLLRPTTSTSTPKYLPIGGSPRIAPISSPRLPPSSPKPSTIPLRVRLIHILALGPATEQSLQEKTRALRTELSTCLQEVARKLAPGSNQWELKDESYRDLKPREWKNYTSKEREAVEKKQMEVLARLPAVIEPEPKIAEIPKKRTISDVSDEARPLAMTPVAVDSPVIRASVPSKRPAEEDVANPVRKVGGAIITSRKKATKVTPKPAPNKSTAQEKTSVSTNRSSKPKSTAKENSRIKSAEKVIDSDSDSDIPLERQATKSSYHNQKPAKSTPSSSTVLKGLGISAVEQESKRQPQVISPPASNTYRSRTSSAASSNSYSPPKKRSPLATNEPITARRGNPTPPSPPPSTKKRPREEEEVSTKTDKRQKVTEKPRAQQAPTTSERGTLPNDRSASETKSQQISQEHHELAERFRKLYPEYQQLHRRLQGLDEQRLAKEKTSVDKLFRMQEKLEKWKAVLWKAAGETRSPATASPSTQRTTGMVGVRG